MKNVARIAAALVVCALAPAFAQNAPSPDCVRARPAEAATKPAPSVDGTAPGNSGWSGGLGGSYIGTAEAGSVDKDFQPATAKGVDLRGRNPTTGC